MTEMAASKSEASGMLRILATTDLHCHLLSRDYYADREDPGVGLSRLASLISEARKEAQAQGGVTLLLDNGDALQGSPIGEAALKVDPKISSADTTAVHPLMSAFSALQYDALGLGNHDFNYGLPMLEEVLKDAPCAVVCSNMSAVSPDRALPFVKTTIIERRLAALPDAPVLRIGILSVLPPQTMIWDAHLLEGEVQIQDMVQAAAASTADLRAAGCDLVVALAHTGVGGELSVPNMENALRPIVATVGIDAVIGGHTHLVLPDPEHAFAKPVVMPGAHGSHLGRIDLHLRYGSKGWQVETWQASALPISRRDAWGRLTPLVEEDPSLVEILAEANAQTQVRMKEPVGHSSEALHSYFTFFGQDHGLALTACAQMAAVRPMLAGATAGDLPLLSAVSPGKFGGRSGPENYTDVAAGDLCMRNVADLQVFPNAIWGVTVTGDQLRDWLEMSAGMFNQITPESRNTELVNLDRAGHNFDVIFGLDYEIDVSQPPRFSSSGLVINPDSHRIRNLRWNGAPVSSTQLFAVATNSYRVSGGGNFKMVQKAENLRLPGIKIRDAICDYVSGRLPKDALAEARYPWRLSRLPETRVNVYTGPVARNYLDELPEGLAEDQGVTPNGFLKLRLSL
ncbi:5'-nucleotidase C-terminal domain-containing protein [Pseudophaeobacter arcticus]|uniref:5'-nucleotidase C-terminal domain-containing protein n=1 Tax=Pseudophaeobacter arcticus TaxID=385492 RepID=UPI003A97B240